MNGEELLAIYEQLDERGKRHLEVIAVAELKHTREGLQKARNSILNASTGNLPIKARKTANKGEV